MPALTPNSPASRFEHVIKTYWGKDVVDRRAMSGRRRESLDAVVLDTFYVTTALVGAHDLGATAGYAINRYDPGSPYIEQHAEDIFVERIQRRLDAARPERTMLAETVEQARAAQAMLARVGQPYEYDKHGVIHWDGEQWGLAELVLQVVKLPEHNRHDFLIPWIARELSKLAKAVFDGNRRPASAGSLELTARLKSGVTHSDYWDAVHALYDKAPAIAQWAKETRTDIGKVDLAQALEAIATYEFKTSLVEQGTVVYTFKDGWTVQELRTESALTAEGTNMQNCIAGYHDAVEDGGTRIYSIRDKAGNPHVSMELGIIESRIPESDVAVDRYDARYGLRLAPEEFVASPKRLSWIFKQILGKQNDMPIDPYRDRAREFIDKVFDKEGFGWCIAGGTAKWARFAGRQLNDLDVGEILGSNHVEDDILSGADFTDVNFTGANLSGLDLSACNFSKARLSEANLADSNAEGARFDGAACHFTTFRRANLSGASFDSAHLGGAIFDLATLDATSFRDAAVDGATFDGATTLSGDKEEWWAGVDLTDEQRKQLGFPVVESRALHLDWRTKASRR